MPPFYRRCTVSSQRALFSGLPKVFALSGFVDFLMRATPSPAPAVRKPPGANPCEDGGSHHACLVVQERSRFTKCLRLPLLRPYVCVGEAWRGRWPVVAAAGQDTCCCISGTQRADGLRRINTVSAVLWDVDRCIPTALSALLVGSG